MPEIILETYDTKQRQHRIYDAAERSFSNYYSEQGSGFGTLTFSLARPIGFDYPDIGPGYEVILRKGLRTILFHGFITQIEERRGDSQSISIGAAGFVTLFSFERFNLIVSDTRPDRWVNNETPSGRFRPDAFDHNTSWEKPVGTRHTGIQFKPRRGVGYLVNDRTFLRYQPASGTYVRRLSFDWETAFPNDWPGEFQVRDNRGKIYFSQTVTGSGSKQIVLDPTIRYAEFRFLLTLAGENTAEDNTVYVRIENLAVSLAETFRPTAYDVATRVVGFMSAAYNLDGGIDEITTGGPLLQQLSFENDETPADIMNYLASFGDATLSPMSWGLRLDAKKRVFLESQATVLGEPKYIVEQPSDASASADLTSSAQKIYGVTSRDGVTWRSGLYTNQDAIDDLGGLYRKEALGLGQAERDQAISAVRLALSEKKKPVVSSSIKISGPIRNAAGGLVPVEEIRSGAVVELRDFRSRETSGGSGDLRASVTTFLLVGVEIDLEDRSATLIPAGDRPRFERYIANLERLLQGSA